MYERNYKLLRNKFGEFFLPTLFTSMAGNICLFVDGLIVSFLIGASNLAPIYIVAPVITFVNLIYWMIGLGGAVYFVLFQKLNLMMKKVIVTFRYRSFH